MFASQSWLIQTFPGVTPICSGFFLPDSSGFAPAVAPGGSRRRHLNHFTHIDPNTKPLQAAASVSTMSPSAFCAEVSALSIDGERWVEFHDYPPCAAQPLCSPVDITWDLLCVFYTTHILDVYVYPKIALFVTANRLFGRRNPLAKTDTDCVFSPPV
ncbi:hypothetical protein BU23DRAFT_66964 [Bimuria novae-zelandiae CBS 107.79]|uniref:Uncharacterized protein n=1 Tax=Bimuria novae-zelandiae CBS 107.79 TaxID=1447943 RepID=A0A6A5VGA4_9PLEO|nr:hypothetical protein BU23DRAFT_66964 [Bimuria novae-zelandiae CBS 107.79]